ncbi:Major facilitator superfamily domain, general substrate transporter [Metarhizium album ARSEF 1941]|uniref:Major facilitator superfamily domain, general substrate transporter n=1 Tax=Metarhizium album (strain ARSEF 1941) TaxID=1081103 RepID=A0A0B2WYM1_METAS|nr:Major facilitator superfamily domain, general substrate transporter [Metarhizium album ARSEF 1941]KHO01367.1 Major facilitator superfamily domain, general substrate transporter [Metarhizium album ARSEF 1941]
MAERIHSGRDLSVPREEQEHVKVDEVCNGTLTLEEDQQILRRIDRWLLPAMALTYFFPFLDKSAVALTSILGLRDGLNPRRGDYSWLSGVYYCGNLVASYPAALLMVRWRVGKGITMSVLAWGIILMFTAIVFNADFLLANRFFLGVAEASIAPGLTLVVSMWYKRSEQPLRHAAWFLGNTCAGIIGGFLASGFAYVKSIEPWKAAFLTLGGASMVWSVGVYFLLPDTLMEARFLNEENREKAVLRVKENMTGIKSDKIKWGQMEEAVLDAKTWMLIALQLASSIPNGAVTAFSSIAVSGIGLNMFDTLLLSCAAFVFRLALVLLTTGGSTYFADSRTYFMSFNYAVGLTGSAMVQYTAAQNGWTRFVASLLAGGHSANFPLIMSLISGNFGGFTKKATVIALSFIAYCTGNIIGPQLIPASDAPSYRSAFIALMVCLTVGFAMCWVIRFHLIWENGRRDAVVSAEEVAAFEEALQGVMVNLTDMTDKQIPQFRYVY